MNLNRATTINHTRRAMLRAGRPVGYQPKLSRWLKTASGGYRPAFLHPTKGIRFGEMPFGFRGAV